MFDEQYNDVVPSVSKLNYSKYLLSENWVIPTFQQVSVTKRVRPGFLKKRFSIKSLEEIQAASGEMVVEAKPAASFYSARF